MKDLRGNDFGYPLMDLAEAYVYRKAFAVDWERHSTWEIHYVLSGVISYELEDGQDFELHGGTFLAIPPRVRHRTQNGSAAPSERLAMRWLPQKPGIRRGQSPLFLSKKDIMGIFTALSRKGVQARPMSNAMLQSAKNLFRRINEIDEKPKGLTAVLLRHACNDMLVNLALANVLPDPIAKGDDVVTDMMKYLDAHLHEKLKMRDLVHISGYGATQLNKLFQDKLGLTPIGYLLRTRIKRARQMLNAGEKPITEIALSCGFPSASYFSTVFHKYCGVSPKGLKNGNPPDQPPPHI